MQRNSSHFKEPSKNHQENMQIRRNFLPRSIRDIGCCLVIFTFIPITFVFELVIVLPDFHDPGSFIYIFTCLLGFFLMFNVQANMLACMLVDTSTRSVVLTPPTKDRQRQYWRLCASCETLCPPRSWHCSACNVCILKRDHHCVFTGCCIGHHNHRYFIYFLIYIGIGSIYATVYNSLYFWWLHADDYVDTMTFVKIVLPMLMLCMDLSWKNFYLLIYMLNIIASAYSLVLMLYHGPSILRGAKNVEKHARKYDLGTRRNLEMIFGKRMHLTWLSPFVKSELPHDGVHWETILEDAGKTR